jgi:hypothetical protein
MKKIPALLCLALAFASRDGQCLDKDTPPAAPGQKGSAASGLTKTLAGLLASKPGTSLAVGSRRILLESLIGGDFASALDCDVAINDYLNREGEVYYEELASVMEDSIRGRFEGEEGSLFAAVDASGEGSVMRFSFYLHREVQLSLPLAVESKDGAFRASCRVDCIASLELSAELVVDSDIVVNGDTLEGIKLNLGEFTLTLSSRAADAEDGAGSDAFEEASPVPVGASYSYGGAEVESDGAYVDLRARASWFLNSPGIEFPEDESEPSYLPYTTIAAGDFTWQALSEGSLRFGSTAAEVDDEDLLAAGRLQFDYAADDIASGSAQDELRVFDVEWSSLEPARGL